jgi:hypothetical protein
MDGINGQIGGDNKAPLLIIDDGEEAAPALTAMEVPAAADAAPAPAFVESLEEAEPAVPPVALAPEPAAPAAPAAPAHKKAAPVAAKAPLSAAANAPLPQASEAAAATPVPGKPKRNIRPLIPLAAVSMAVFASGLSVVGLLVASRTVAETRLVLEQVQQHQSKMRRLDQMIEEIDALRSRQQLALVRLEQINSGKPATGAEVRGAIGSLQLALAKYQPGGANGTLTLLRDGQAELAERVTTMYRRVEQIDSRLDKLGIARTRPTDGR